MSAAATLICRGLYFALKHSTSVKVWGELVHKMCCLTKMLQMSPLEGRAKKSGDTRLTVLWKVFLFTTHLHKCRNRYLKWTSMSWSNKNCPQFRHQKGVCGCGGLQVLLQVQFGNLTLFETYKHLHTSTWTLQRVLVWSLHCDLIGRSDCTVTPDPQLPRFQNTAQLSRTPHSKLSAACFCFFVFFFQVDGSILVRNPFSHEHLSQSVHYSWRPITPDWLSCPLKNRETHWVGGRGSGPPVWDRPLLTTVSSGMDYCCAVTSLCGWKAFSLINVQCVFACVCATGPVNQIQIWCARVFLHVNICGRLYVL